MKFVIPVNEAGLPKHYCVGGEGGLENVTGLSASEVAWVYWMLKEVEIVVEWEVNGVGHRKEVKLESKKLPVERQWWPAQFDGEWVRLGLGAIRKVEEGYGMEFDLNLEGDGWSLCTGDLWGMRKVSGRKVKVCGKEVEIGLWMEEGQGVIRRLEVKEGYFEIK